METNDLKEMWKSGLEKEIQLYSDKELNEIVVKSARKSIRGIYPSGVFILIIIAVITLLIVNITVRHISSVMRLLDLTLLLIIAISLTLWLVSFWIMRKYKADLPIKEWLEYRIKEIEKALNFRAKYNLGVCFLTLLVALGYYYLSIWINAICISIWTICGVTIGIIIFVFLSQKFTVRNYKKTLKELKELYKQTEE